MESETDEMDAAYSAAEGAEMAISGLSWDLMTPSEREWVVEMLEDLTWSIRDFERATIGRLDKLAAVEPGVTTSGDEVIDMILADPYGASPAEAKEIVTISKRTIERMKATKVRHDAVGGEARSGPKEAVPHNNPPACYIRP